MTWSQFSFYFMLVGPGLLYVAATILIPRRGEPPESWEAHFLHTRRSFLAALLLFGLWGISMTRLLRDLSLLHPYRATQATLFLLLLSGLLVENRRFQSDDVHRMGRYQP